jgi:prepilin-type N-terminal cleavage/methylation domain-containing protein
METGVLKHAGLAGRRGVTLIEVMIAMSILTIVLLGMSRFAWNFTRAVQQSEARTIGVNLIDQKLSEIRSAPNYAGLETAYNGSEPSIVGFTGYARATTITHTGGPRPTYTNDYKTITVSVTAPGIANPIKKTIVVAAP